MKAVVSPEVAKFFSENPEQRHTAVRFRGTVYVGCPRHLDALNVAFDGMTRHEKWRVGDRIADGKEELLFGSALGDGSGWEHDAEYQNARLKMYGFD